MDQQQVFDAVTAANRAAAIAWTDHLVESVVVPAGATRLEREPRVFGRGGRPFTCYTDTTLGLDAWWIVDLDIRAVARFLVQHVPAGLHLPRRGVRREVGWPYVDLRGRSPQPEAFTDPCLGLELRRSGAGRTFVRATTALRALGPRDPAAAVVPPVQRVTVVVSGLQEQRAVTRRTTYVGDDPVALDLVRRLDALPATAQPAGGSLGCPYQTASVDIHLVIRDVAGRLVGHVQAPFCGGQLEMRRNGRETVGTLDPEPIYQQLDALTYGSR